MGSEWTAWVQRVEGDISESEKGIVGMMGEVLGAGV
jgi:hypothetical protein